MPIETITVAAARTDSGWIAPARLGWDTTTGRFTEVASAERGAPSVRGIAIAGVPDVHGHAFQRLMAGSAERLAAGRSADTFWTWRETMYALADRVGPDELEAVATWLQIEMLAAGYTEIGEFHYLHRADEGRQAALAMARAHVRAAERTGIRLCLLPVLYTRGGFDGEPLDARQRRFAHRDVDEFLDFRADIRDQVVAGAPRVRLGAAPHSLRAAPVDAIRTVARELAREPEACIHIHLAEQLAEVEACIACHGVRPATLLLDRVGDLSDRWCYVHATHLSDDELGELAATGGVAGLCPTTEANLGDGVFRGSDWLAAGGRIGVGSDSHVTVDAAAELQLLEYSQRLVERRRCVFAAGDGETDTERSTGEALFERAVAGGRQALGAPVEDRAGGLAVAGPADFVVLDAEHPAFAGREPSGILDAWIFSTAGRAAVRDVYVAGVQRVHDRRHASGDDALAAFRQVCERLLHDVR